MARRMALAAMTLAGAVALVVLWSDGAGAATPPAPPLASVQVAGLPPVTLANPLPTPVAAAPGPAPSVSPGTTGASLGSLVSVVVTPPAPLAPAVQPAADAIAALTSAAPTSGSVPDHPLAPVAGALRSLVAGLPGVTDPAGLMSVVVPLRSELGDRAATGGARLAPDLAQVTGVKGFADAAFAAPRVAIELGTGASRGLDALGHALVGGADGALSAAVGSAGGSGSGPSAAVVALFTFTIAALWRRVRPAARTALAPAFLFGSARPG